MPTADDMLKLVDIIMVNRGHHAQTLCFYIQIVSRVDVPGPPAPTPDPYGIDLPAFLCRGNLKTSAFVILKFLIACYSSPF